MSWGAVIGGGIALAGNMMSDDKNGGAGTQTQSKEPWAPAQPWLMQNLMQGQLLQNQYTAQPFSPRQQAAYDNSYAQSDYMRDLVPSLLGQMQDQPVGFDPANPLARPKAWDWNALAGTGNGLGQRSLREIADAAPAKNEPSLSDFMQQNDVLSGMNMTGQTASGGLLGSGGYGAFRYGMDVQPGTKEYRDMQEYFLMGGVDPNGKYGGLGGGQGRAASVYQQANPFYSHPIFGSAMHGGAPGEAEGPSSGAPGGAASSGPGGTF